MTCPGCGAARECDPPRRAVYGITTLASGQTYRWLEFVDARLTPAEAAAEAVRIASSGWHNPRCRVTEVC